MRFQLFECGHCLSPEFLTLTGGAFKNTKFPSTVAALEHPKEGIVLFDTGYTHHFFDASRSFPEKLYALATPIHIDDSQTAKSQLMAAGIRANDVRHIVISHFHADHIAGLNDFPAAKFHFAKEGLDYFLQLGRLSGVLKGFLRKLLPHDFNSRTQPIAHSSFMTYANDLDGIFQGYDLFQDGRIILTPLPGHCVGHLGLYTPATTQPLFFLGDATWHLEGIKDLKYPHKLLVDLLGDFDQYSQTIAQLNQFAQKSPQTLLVPCHCSKTHASIEQILRSPRISS